MAKLTNVINTPFGNFTRKSGTAYGFAAVAEAAVNPEAGLRVTGNRIGDPALSETYEYQGKTHPGTQRVRYHIVWSRTEAGARKNAEGYVWQAARCVGVYPVDHFGLAAEPLKLAGAWRGDANGRND
jgi:hypothetical protein